MRTSSRMWMAALALCAHGAGAAGAQTASAMAEVTRFSYEVIDLAPDDGVPAGLSLGAGSFNSRSAHGLGLVAEEIERDELSGLGSTGLVKPFGYAATGTDGLRWSARSSISGDPAGVPSMYAMVGWDLGVTLAPNTRAVFTVTGTIQAQSAGAGAGAFSLVALQGESQPNPPAVAYFLDTANGARELEDFTLTGAMQSAADPLQGALFVWMYVDSRLGVPAPPVPEPASWTMLPVGVALLAALARGRRFDRLIDDRRRRG